MPELVENPGVPWRNDLIRKNSCEIPKGPPLLTAIFPESSEEVRHLWQPGDSFYQKFLVDAVCMNNFGRLQK